MSFTDKMALVLALLEKHNSNIENPVDRVDISAFQSKLRKFGGTTEEALAECTWEDIENCGLPRLLARKAAEIFRSRPANALSNKKVDRFSVLELIQRYNPSELDSNITRELRKRSEGKRIIVLAADGSVMVEKSHDLYKEIVLQKFPERETVSVTVGNSRVDFRTYRVGEGKPELFDESPIFKGRALRPDGTDDQLNRSWEGVPFEVRQFIRVAVDVGELKPTHDKAHDILDIAIGNDPMNKLRERYRKASVKFGELLQSSDLPKLKVTRVQNSSVKSKQDPFYGQNEELMGS